MHSALLVWWINSDEVESAGLTVPLPPYILRELLSLRGRPARRRLWVPRGIVCESLPVDDDVPGWHRIDETAGGLVFLPADFDLVKLTGYGYVTDVHLREVG